MVDGRVFLSFISPCHDIQVAMERLQFWGGIVSCLVLSTVNERT
jgi:hypothetical protein